MSHCCLMDDSNIAVWWMIPTYLVCHIVWWMIPTFLRNIQPAATEVPDSVQMVTFHQTTSSPAPPSHCLSILHVW